MYAKQLQHKNLTNKSSFIKFMRKSPLVGVKIDLIRDTSKCREIKI